MSFDRWLISLAQEILWWVKKATYLGFALVSCVSLCRTPAYSLCASPYNSPVFLFLLWHHRRCSLTTLPSFPLPAPTGNELRRRSAVKARVDKDTPVSTTREPVFPLGLLLKWGTNLGHIKKVCWNRKCSEGGDTQGMFLGSRVFTLCINSACTWAVFLLIPMHVVCNN